MIWNGVPWRWSGMLKALRSRRNILSIAGRRPGKSPNRILIPSVTGRGLIFLTGKVNSSQVRTIRNQKDLSKRTPKGCIYFHFFSFQTCPEMHNCISPPGPPLLRRCQHLGRTSLIHGFHHSVVRIGKCIGPSERAHCHILSGPAPYSRKIRERLTSLDIASRLKTD